MRKYDATYQNPGSNAIVHIVAPPPMTAEEIEAVLQEYDAAFWEVWNSLSVEDQLRINAEYKNKAG